MAGGWGRKEKDSCPSQGKWNANRIVQDLNSISDDDNRYAKLAFPVYEYIFELPHRFYIRQELVNKPSKTQAQSVVLSRAATSLWSIKTKPSTDTVIHHPPMLEQKVLGK